jgi:hypothetical protein
METRLPFFGKTPHQPFLTWAGEHFGCCGDTCAYQHSALDGTPWTGDGEAVG